MATTSAPSHKLTGQVAVITGGTAGIGLALAERLLSLDIGGLVVSSRSEDKVQNAVRTLQQQFPDKKDSLLGIAGSNFDWDQILNVFQKTQDRFGSINYVFANAGETSAWNANLETPTKPDLSITENMIRGNVYTLHAAVPFLRKAQGDKAFIISGSDTAYSTFSVNPLYAMAKAASSAQTHTYADWLKPHGIRIINVAPGWVKTQMSDYLEDPPLKGGLKAHEYTPMGDVIDAYIQATTDTTQTGAVLRLSGPEQAPFWVHQPKPSSQSINRWGPIFASLQSGGQ